MSFHVTLGEGIGAVCMGSEQAPTTKTSQTGVPKLGNIRAQAKHKHFRTIWRRRTYGSVLGNTAGGPLGPQCPMIWA